MKRTTWLVLASGAFCLGSVLLNGCSSASNAELTDEGLYPPKKAGPAEALTELAYTDVATITGTVSYEGDAPERSEIGGIGQHADRAICFGGDVKDQSWMVDPASKAVRYVVIYFRPPAKTYFKKPDDKLKNWEDEVKVDQPFCAFTPHVVVLYPQYYADGRQLVPTGQRFKVLNSATIGHNIRLAGTSDTNPVRGGTLSSKTGEFIFDQIKVDKRELTMNCDIHKWMTGYALTFDHPYAAVTDKDGKFTIKNVPAGVELTLKGWHEGLKTFDPDVEGGTKIKLNPGETRTLDFKIKKR